MKGAGVKQGKLRRYKCRQCGIHFKDHYLPEEKRVCAACLMDIAKSI